MVWWDHRPETTLFADEGYLVPRYPQNVARAFISINYDDRDPDDEDWEKWPPYYQLMTEAIESFAQRWGGLDEATFLRVLREGHGRDKLAAIFTIGHSQLPQAIDVLTPFLTDSDQLVRSAAACCLGLRRDERALPVLKEYLLSDVPTLKQGPLLRIAPEAELWYNTYKSFIARVLATWGPSSMVSVLRTAFLRIWEEECKHDPGPTEHYTHDAICYALGRRRVLAALHGIELPDYRRRLAMIYLALGYVRADERFNDLGYEIIVNDTLRKEVVSVFVEHFALSEEEGWEVLRLRGEDDEKRTNWFDFVEDDGVGKEDKEDQ